MYTGKPILNGHVNTEVSPSLSNVILHVRPGKMFWELIPTRKYTQILSKSSVSHDIPLMARRSAHFQTSWGRLSGRVLFCVSL